MYNYNTTDGSGAGAFIRELVIKLIFVIILVLLLIWLFPMPNMQPFYDRIYTENITLMKDTAKNYYTTERLPVKVNDKVTMTLGEMVDKHLILNLTDKNGNTCSTTDSYVEVTRLATEYELKTTLVCGAEEEYIVEYIGCHDVCTSGTCKQETVTPTKVVTKPLVKTVTKTVTKTNTVIKYVEKECPTCPTKPDEPDKPCTETWVLYGKPSTDTVSDWSTTKKTTGSTTSNGITTTISLYDSREFVTEEGGTDYDRESAYVYSMGWISSSSSTPYTLNYKSAVGARLLDLDELGLSDEAQDLSRSDLDLEIGSPQYYSSSDYSKCEDNCGRTLYMADGDNGWVSMGSASTLQSHALTGGTNFTVSRNDLAWNSSYDAYEVLTTLYIKNFTGASSYYDSRIGVNLYYLPYKFKLTWNEPTTTDDESEWRYKYKTTVSYQDIWVLKGSSEETRLVTNGYTAKQTKTVTK